MLQLFIADSGKNQTRLASVIKDPQSTGSGKNNITIYIHHQARLPSGQATMEEMPKEKPNPLDGRPVYPRQFEQVRSGHKGRSRSWTGRGPSCAPPMGAAKKEACTSLAGSSNKTPPAQLNDASSIERIRLGAHSAHRVI